ncbi:MAG: hypothetical protein LBS74_11670 [Oscillospiraceae bacterium]|jgi:hypothetical protein|nr:hypothetical protein [Oscillospiraceae bacterium]
MKKSALAIFLIFSLILLPSCDISQGDSFGGIFSAVFNSEKQSFTQIPPLSFKTGSYTPLRQEYAYAQLETEEMRAAYKSLCESMYYISSEKAEDSKSWKLRRTSIPSLNSLEIFKVKEAIMADHPEAFWLSLKYSIGYSRAEGDYVILYSTSAPDTVLAKAKAMEEAVNNMLSRMEGGLSELERELYLHDALIKACEYDNAAVERPELNQDSYSAYGALVNLEAVCSGYAPAFKLLLNLSGIECVTVTGTGKGQGHMWNAARINGEWYQVDTTWDDPKTKSEDVPVYYWYFNISDEFMKKDHEYGVLFSQVTNKDVESGVGSNYYNFDLPACNSMSKNFFALNAHHVQGFSYKERKKLVSYMEEIVAKGESTLYLEIDKSLEVSEAVNWLYYGDSPAFEHAAGAINEKGLYRKIKKYVPYTFTQDGNEYIWSNIIIIKLIFE